MVCRLHKALYGLKQTPRAWYERIHIYLMKIGFERTNDNNNLYLKTKKGKGILISKFFVMISYLEFKILYVNILKMK